MPRSKCDPSFFTPLGLRFMFMRSGGSLASSRLFESKFRADFTLVELSFMLAPAKPTMSIAGKARLKDASMLIIWSVSLRLAVLSDFIIELPCLF